MPAVVTYLVEASVGIACLIVAVSIGRRPGLRLWSALLGVAGAAAVLHATIALL